MVHRTLPENGHPEPGFSARKNSKSSWVHLVTVLLSGSILGAFLSRVLAEISWVSWPFHSLGLTLALILTAGFGLVALWWMWPIKTIPIASFVPFFLLVVYIVQPLPNLLQAGVMLVGVLGLAFILSTQHTLDERWAVPLLFLVPFALYLSTLTPGVGERDGYELQAISATLGYAHPTGYPLFPILGRIWIALLPFGSIAWRINVLCALYAAAGVPLVYGVARRVLGRQTFAAWSALVLAFSRTFWMQASQPEKYTLNAFFVALILYIAFGTVDPEARGPHPHLRWLAFVYGLSLTHHRTMLMLGPALAVYVLWRDPGLLGRPKEWSSALGCAVAPLAIYLYIPWRACVQGQCMSASTFFQYISGSYYGPAIHLLDWLSPERALMFWRFLLAQFGAIGMGLGVLGLFALVVRRRWRFLICTTLAYFTYYIWGTVWYAYYNDVNSFIPNHILFAVWMGHGALVAWRAWVAAGLRFFRVLDRPGGRSRIVKAIGGSLLALLPMWMIWYNFPQVDLSEAWGLTRWGEYAIAQDLTSGATVLADREKHPPLDYFARVEKRRPDLDVVILGDEKTYLDRLLWDLAHDKTVYLARFLPGLDGPYHLRSVGPLVEVGTTPLLVDDTAFSSDVRFQLLGSEAVIALLDHRLDAPQVVASGETIYLTLLWHSLAPAMDNYQVNLRLVDANGAVRWSSSRHPVSDMYPTVSWKVGEVIPDWHEIPISETLLPGNYVLELGLFPPFSSAGLEYAARQTWLPVRDLTVGLQRPSKIPHMLSVVAPKQWQLLGYDLPGQAPPTGRVPLTLYWKALSSLPDYEIGTHVVPADMTEHEGEWIWQEPGDGTYSTSRWEPNKVVVTTHMLTMPAEIGRVRVEVAVRERGEGGQRITFHPGWLKPIASEMSLPLLTVAGRAPATPGTFNFDDRILLTRFELEQKTLSPGAPLDLAVEWQCMQTMEVDYTLFVQLVDASGALKGQIDVWPQNGTHPTSAWREAEIIPDRYTVHLSQDAPPGDYRVVVGWYLLETMQRLPVLDAQGGAISDHVQLPSVRVTE
ncbi:MAG: DUF2723 domain-containing protein [Anaerolineae bacterium]|nr:DUF2723 domain-containing protein [Anaerolineae bacterium]